MGVYITKRGVSAKTNADIQNWYFSTGFDTFKYLQTLVVSVHVTDYNGAGSGSASNTVSVPAQYNFTPYYFSFLTDTVNVGYDFIKDGVVSESSVTYDSATNQYTLALGYNGGGAISYTVTASIYIFGNAV